MKSSDPNKVKVSKRVDFRFDEDPPASDNEHTSKPVNEALKAANMRDGSPGMANSTSQANQRTSDNSSRNYLAVPSLEQVEEDHSGEATLMNQTGNSAQMENHDSRSRIRQTSIMDGLAEYSEDQQRNQWEGAQQLKRQNIVVMDESPREREGQRQKHFNGHGQHHRDSQGIYSNMRRETTDDDDVEETSSMQQRIEDHISAPDPVTSQKPEDIQPAKDKFSFTQRHDPKWAAMVALLARNDVDQALKIVEEQDQDLKTEKEKLHLQGAAGSKDFIFNQINHLFAFAKCYLLKADQINFSLVAEKLRLISGLLESLVSKTLNIDQIKHELAENSSKEATRTSSLSKQQNNALKGFSEANLVYKELRWVLQSFGLLAAFYNAIGMQVQCEKAYVRYVQLIEQFFNSDSLETSNAYFLVGIYYFEQNVTHKSIACFRKALAIRENKFKPMHISCSDCLLNLGILYKLRGLVDQARQSLERALRIRQEAIGVESLPAAAVHEELGKFFLEEENFQESYINLKRCYNIRKKIYSNKRVQDVERIATLLVFLHRKIELQIVDYKTSFQKGGLKLLTQIGHELANTISGVHAQQQAQADESFSFLRQLDGEGNMLEVSDTQTGESDMASENGDRRDRRGFKAERPPQIGSQLRISGDEMSKLKEEQTERAMRNFKARGKMVPEQRSTQLGKSRSSADRDVSSDSSIEALVSKGVSTAYQVAEKTIKENFHPYAVSFMLSLSAQQVQILQEKQLLNTTEKDPLYLSNQFLESLDFIQEKLLRDSKLWLIPRKQLVKKTAADQLIDRKATTEREGPQVGRYMYYSIKLSHLLVPEAQDKVALRKQHKKDQTIFKFIQKAPEFIKTLQPCQSNLFRNVMNYNYTLRYFFLSIQSEQVAIINDLIKGKNLAVNETEKLTWIFSEFFNLKGISDGAMAQAIIQDQIENGNLQEDADMIDQDYIKEQYSTEICLLFKEFNTISDYKQLNPRLLDMDDNFLSSELQLRDVEELGEKFDQYDEILEHHGEYDNWYQNLIETFQDVIQMVNTKILYLIYRKVKLVHTKFQKTTKQEAVKRKTKDFGQGLIMHHQSHFQEGQSESSHAGFGDSEFERDSKNFDSQQFQAAAAHQRKGQSPGLRPDQEYTDTFGPGGMDFGEEPGNSPDHMHHGAYYADSALNSRLGKQFTKPEQMKIGMRVPTATTSKRSSNAHGQQRNAQREQARGQGNEKIPLPNKQFRPTDVGNYGANSSLTGGYGSNKIQANQSVIKTIVPESFEESYQADFTKMARQLSNHKPKLSNDRTNTKGSSSKHKKKVSSITENENYMKSKNSYGGDSDSEDSFRTDPEESSRLNNTNSFLDQLTASNQNFGSKKHHSRDIEDDEDDELEREQEDYGIDNSSEDAEDVADALMNASDNN